jgi:NitT/TauT family transport system ATP-binding protein
MAIQTATKISVNDVGKTFVPKRGGEVAALEHVNLIVGEGELVSIVGPSGCGKSTLLRMCAGLERPSSGDIEIFQADPNRAPTAVVFQDYSIFPWRTVMSNVGYGLELKGVAKQERERISQLWIDRVGLSGFERSYPAALSGGMKQRVSIARAFALDPEILLLDEPFAALDAQMRDVMQEELLRQWDAVASDSSSRSAVLVTHSLDEAILLGDRVVLMTRRPGRIRAVFDVPFPRPRAASLRSAPAFGELREEIWRQLREEVVAGLQKGGR